MLSAGLIRQTVGLGMLAVPLLLGLRASASEAPPPVVTVETAAQHDGQVAAVEVNVVEVKFAQRRKMYFLSGNPNFRSQTNLPVAIRASDFEAFEKAGIADLSAKYLGQRVRASGKVVGDEGQWLLVVAGPADINILSPAPAVDTLRAVTIVDEQGRETGQAPLDTHRNQWIVERKNFLDERQRMAEVLRNAEMPAADGIRRHPELEGSYMQLQMGRALAEQQFRDKAQREQFVDHLRAHIAQRIEYGRPLDPVMLRGDERTVAPRSQDRDFQPTR